jgi:serine phosphatase RsbU (regulator of sigma subunit)
MAAALLMANLQANLRSQCATASEDPRRFLRSVNQLLCKNTSESDYSTLFFAGYDDCARRLRYSNCGHPPALLLRADRRVEWLGATSTVIGLFEQWDCVIEERQLFPGDTLLLYTDGATEAFNQAEEEFGEQRSLACRDCSRARLGSRDDDRVIQNLRCDRISSEYPPTSSRNASTAHLGVTWYWT